MCAIFQGGIISVGENAGRKKVMGESVWWGMFRAGNNRGETFRGEFSGGEYSSHQKTLPLSVTIWSIVTYILLMSAKI